MRVGFKVGRARQRMRSKRQEEEEGARARAYGARASKRQEKERACCSPRWHKRQGGETGDGECLKEKEKWRQKNIHIRNFPTCKGPPVAS